MRGFVHTAYFHVGRDRMEDMLRRSDVSGMRRLADIGAMAESYIVIVAGDDLLIWRDNEADVYGDVKRADPDGG